VREAEIGVSGKGTAGIRNEPEAQMTNQIERNVADNGKRKADLTTVQPVFIKTDIPDVEDPIFNRPMLSQMVLQLGR